jgi:hypothetical protein
MEWRFVGGVEYAWINPLDCRCIRLFDFAEIWLRDNLPHSGSWRHLRGSITIDPATPCSTCGPAGIGTYLGTYYNAGSMIVNLDGTEFAGTALYVEVLAENAGPDHCKH